MCLSVIEFMTMLSVAIVSAARLHVLLVVRHDSMATMQLTGNARSAALAAHRIKVFVGIGF